MRWTKTVGMLSMLVAGTLLGGNRSCTPVPQEPTCVYGDSVYDVGESFPSDDGCNTCTCMADGNVACTLMACGCMVGDDWYGVGESFPAEDGCNTCTCTLDGVSCTEMACPPDDCDPSAEWQRDYLGQSPEACAVIRFTCPPNTEAFFNDCGCGCEQGDDCPQWFNCMPGPGVPGCDVDWIHEHCPYSDIAW